MDTSDPDFIDSAARDVVTVAGPDAATYLQSQVAQELRPLDIGASCWTLVLEPAGKVVALARVTRADDDSFELDTDAGFGEGLAARLERFKIRVDAEIAVTAAERAEPSGEAERRRVETGWPRMGAEIVPGETIPASTGVVRVAVDFTKGCYPGQELVERMESRGSEAPRVLRILEVDSDTEAGDAAVDESGIEVGVITSVAGTTALALVRRDSQLGSAPTHSG